MASLVILPAAGCSLVLDFSDGAIPKDAAADAPFSPAECDYKEPNDTRATAAPITPADTGPAAVCAAADHDFYKLTVPAMTAGVTIQIGFPHRALGDLDLRLYDAVAPQPIAESHRFAGDDELLTCPGAGCAALAAGDYVFEVFAVTPGAINDYTIALTLTAM